jgi:hypothetical protein
MFLPVWTSSGALELLGGIATPLYTVLTRVDMFSEFDDLNNIFHLRTACVVDLYISLLFVCVSFCYAVCRSTL